MQPHSASVRTTSASYPVETLAPHRSPGIPLIPQCTHEPSAPALYTVDQPGDSPRSSPATVVDRPAPSLLQCRESDGKPDSRHGQRAPESVHPPSPTAPCSGQYSGQPGLNQMEARYCGSPPAQPGTQALPRTWQRPCAFGSAVEQTMRHLNQA